MTFFKSKSKKDFGADNIREKLTDASPILIIICFTLSLISFGVLKYNYQVSLFSAEHSVLSISTALLIALVSQLGRLAFGLVGVRDLVRGKRVMGILGIAASVGLTLYEHFEINRMVEHWGNPHLWYPIAFLVWVALIAELRLMMTMSGSEDEAKLEEEHLLEAEAKEQERREAERARMERQIKTEYEIKAKESDLNRRLEYFREKEQALQKEETERKARFKEQQDALRAREEQDRKERAARMAKEETERKAKKEAKKEAKKAKQAKQSEAELEEVTKKLPKKLLGNGLKSANGQHK